LKSDDISSTVPLLRSTAVSGIHVDDEFCSGRSVDNKTLQLTACAKFLGSLANKSATLAAASAHLPHHQRLTLSVDVFPWWVCPESSTCRPPYCGCLNITWNGYSKSVAEHVVDIADEVVLMGYTTQPALTIAHALPYLQIASAHPQTRRVRVGLAISGCVAGHVIDHPEQNCTHGEAFELGNETAMLQLMTQSFFLLIAFLQR
jgi:hypothetical protein